MKHLYFTFHRVSTVAVILLLGCHAGPEPAPVPAAGGSSPLVGTPAAAGLPQFPPAAGQVSPVHRTSDTESAVLGKDAVVEYGAGNRVEGNTLTLIPGGGQLAYAEYAVPELTSDRPVLLCIDAVAAEESPGGAVLPLRYWVGIANYTLFRWDWFGVRTAAASITLNSSDLRDRYINTDGTLYFLVLVADDAEAGVPGAKVNSGTVTTSATYFVNNPYHAEFTSALLTEDPLSYPQRHVDLAWEHVAALSAADQRNEAGIYQVYRRGPGDPGPVLIGAKLAPYTSYVDPDDNTGGVPDLTVGTYRYYLRALNDSEGASPLSIPRRIEILPNNPPVIDSAVYDELTQDLVVTASDPDDGSTLYVSVTEPDGLVADCALKTASATGPLHATFHWTAEDLGAGGSGDSTVTVSDLWDGSDETIVPISVAPVVLDDDTLYGIPLQTSVDVDTPVTIVVTTGPIRAGAPLMYLNSARIMMENGWSYEDYSFNVGAVGGAIEDVDGIWTAVDPSGGFLLPPDGLYVEQDLSGGMTGLDFNVVPMGGSDVTGVGGELFNFQVRFSKPGVYRVRFERFNQLPRTYYSDGVGTEYYWTDITNDHAGFDNSVTVAGGSGLYIYPDPADADWNLVTGAGLEVFPFILSSADYLTQYNLLASTLPDGAGDAIDVNDLTWEAYPPFIVDWAAAGTFIADLFTAGYLFATTGDLVQSNKIYLQVHDLPDTAGFGSVLVRTGDEYEALLPNQRVSTTGSEALFTPDWDPYSGPTKAGLAYAWYGFGVSGYSGPPEISCTWSTPPDDYTHAWLGIANYAMNTVEWFCMPPNGDPLPLDDLNPYTSPTGDVCVVVLLTGTMPAQLTEVRIGS